MAHPTLSSKDILELLKEMIVTYDNNRLGLEYYDVKLSTTLVDLGFDSIDIVELCLNLESILNIQISDEECERIIRRNTIEGIMNFLFSRYKETHSL